MAALVAERERGELRTARVREAARSLGVGERTLWRWVTAGRAASHGRPSLRRVELDDELRDAYLRLSGNVAAVWREQRDLGRTVPPLRTLQAAFARELRPAERASAKRGEAGRREHGLYLRYEAPHRNAVWQADHKQLPILVIAAEGRRARRPWVTQFVDDYSRAIMGWAISLQPTSAEVLAALRDALLVQPGRGPFGGVPDRLRWDRGLEFAAGAVEHAALALGVELDPCTSYAPHEKGKIERLHRTIAETFIATLPGYTDGPKDIRGRLEDAGEPLLLKQLVEGFAGWVLAYNAERPHRSLNGLTPQARFTGDPTPLVLVAPEDARRLLLARRSARVRRDGVHHGGLPYIAVELTELVGETVELAFAPHDQRCVEVYWRGAWLCTAIPQGALSAAQQAQIMAERRADAGELRRRQRRATKRARGRLAPATADQPAAVEVVRLPDSALDEPQRQGPREEALRAAARVDLLLPPAGTAAGSRVERRRVWRATS